MKRKLCMLILACALASGSVTGCSGTSAPTPGTAYGTAANPTADSSASAADSPSADTPAGDTSSDLTADGLSSDPAGKTTDSAAGDTSDSAPSGPDTNAPDASDRSGAASSAGDTASGPVFEARDMDGNTVTSDVFSQSKLTMINVWATYCSPCLNEMPGLGELAQEYASEDFQLIGIISDVTEGADAKAEDYAAKLISLTGAAYPHLLFNESLYYAFLKNVMAVPTTLFFDQNGKLVDTSVGSKDKSSWKEQIDELLENQ